MVLDSTTGVGTIIKQKLASKGMTIKALSERSGVSVYTLYNITKRDPQNVNLDTLRKISEVLKADPKDFLGATITQKTEEFPLLRHCPVCGELPAITERFDRYEPNTVYYYVSCEDENHSFGFGSLCETSRSRAIEKWNSLVNLLEENKQ